MSDSISEKFDEMIEALLGVGTRIIVICTNPSLERVIHLLELGVHGVMLDDSSPLEVATGVQAVARGGMALNPTVAVTLVQHWPRLRQDLARSDARIAGSLTPREAEVLEAMVEGLSTKAIARRLGVAYKTVENHKIRVFEKLQVRTHAQAVSVAIGRQLVLMAPDKLRTALSRKRRSLRAGSSTRGGKDLSGGGTAVRVFTECRSLGGIRCSAHGETRSVQVRRRSQLADVAGTPSFADSSEPRYVR